MRYGHCVVQAQNRVEVQILDMRLKDQLRHFKQVNLLIKNNNYEKNSYDAAGCCSNNQCNGC